MAQYNENFFIAGPNPVDFKYMSPRTVNGIQQPYSGTTEVFDEISTTHRHEGLTVLIDDGVSRGEYWFGDDIDTLIPKITGDGIGTITGATNIGFFSGTTAVQTLNISASSGLPVGDYTEYSGGYASLYNYFYRDEQGFVRIGESVDGYLLRAYVKTTSPVKSWIWNDKDDGIDSKGWYLIDGDVNLLIGTEVSGIDYGTPYLNTTWLNQSYNNGSNIVISSVVGDLTGGTTLTVGGPVYAQTINNNTTLEFRTVRSLTPETLSVSYDDVFINISSAISYVITGGTNSIYSSDNVVKLGGDLIENTVIGGSNYNHSLSIKNINVLCLETSCGILADNTNSNPFEYGGDYFTNAISTYAQCTIPDIGMVCKIVENTPLIKPICNLTVDTYLAQSTDFYIGASGGTSITLPITPPSGTIIVVADICGDATTGNEVQINTSGSQFFGGSSESLINTGFGSYTYIYNGGKNRWGVLAFNPAAV